MTASEQDELALLRAIFGKGVWIRRAPYNCEIWQRDRVLGRGADFRQALVQALRNTRPSSGEVFAATALLTIKGGQ
jgi:hypothetical protein